MGMPVFPTYVLMLAEGYGEEPDYGMVRTDMDGGMPKERSRFSVPIITQTISIRVRSDADKQQFDSWVRNDLAGGVGWFNWLDPVDGRQKRARLSGKPPYRWQRDGPQRWQAQLQIETIG